MKIITQVKNLTVASCLIIGGCISPTANDQGRYADPIGGAPVIDNGTPYSAALKCLATNHNTAAKFTVASILDYTKKKDFEGGSKITQGAALMAMTALNKAGAKLVERLDTSVTDKDLKYANNKLLGDAGSADPFRKIHAGIIHGSDYFITGGVTELNHNIRSNGIDSFGNQTTRTGPKVMFKAKQYVMNVGLDLRLVNSKTLEVVDAISYQKQIIGHEVGVGAFAFFGGTKILDLGIGEKGLEPIQLAIRSVVERGIYSMLTKLYNVQENSCYRGFGSQKDVLGPNAQTQTGHVQAAPAYPAVHQS